WLPPQVLTRPRASNLCRIEWDPRCFRRLFTRRIWLLRPPLTATAGPAGSLVSRRGYGAVLHQDVAVAGARRPDANSVPVFHHDDVEHDVLIARQNLTQGQLVGRDTPGVDDPIDHAVIVRSEIVEHPGVAHGGERKQRVLVHGARWPGAFN